jgi:hypothetical protein
MSEPMYEMRIGDLVDKVLSDYADGLLTKNRMIMTPEEALEHFKQQAIEEGFDKDLIADCAEELHYCLEDVVKTKYGEYLEERE